MCNRKLRIISGLSVLVAATAPAAPPSPPIRLLLDGEVKDAQAAGGARTSFGIMRLPNGGFAFYDRHAPKEPLQLQGEDGQLRALLPHLPPEILQSSVILNSVVLDNSQVIYGQDGEIKSVFVRNEALDRETAAKVGLPRYLNVWIQRAGLKSVFEPRMTWRGYNGSQMEYQQLANGRLVVPHGSFQPHARPVPPDGRHKTIVEYSDDGGLSWHLSSTELVSPCYPGFNGANEGACEPAIEELKDGRIWMLMRTQAGFLYESFSDDDGTTWSPAKASRFNTSTGPPNIMRHKNGWLVVCWNNCEMPPRADGEGVYGGRDALHVAVSDDEGKRWRGFREIYLDHRRNDNPAKSGDRGTAYPLGAYTQDGRIVVIAGQGQGGRNPILVDPEWITAKEAFTDFSDGLRQWSVFKHHGPAKRWWQARAVGCELIDNPTDSSKRCLAVRRPDDLPPDGATWNFPNGWKGALTLRLMIRDGFQGGAVCLNDRFFDPVNDLGEELAVFRMEIDSSGSLTETPLKRNVWVNIRLVWDISRKECLCLVDDRPAGRLPLRHPTLNGISYLRLRSTAEQTDTVGLLVDRVDVSVADPYAPQHSDDDVRAHEQRYIDNVTVRWAAQQQQD
ncbi:MAG: exo-alpha-sialidase [Planctomycetaceae bacterium]|nr:exo-alpha-sialidase [Planctomycetaceae bacterium]